MITNKYNVVMMHTHSKTTDNYMSDSIGNLHRSGIFKSKLLSSFLVFETSKPFNYDNPGNALRVLKEAYKNDTEWTIFLENDIDVIDNFLESVDAWIEDHYDDEVSFYPLCCAYRELFDCEESAWKYPLNYFYGSQAYCINRKNLESLIHFSETNKLEGYHDMIIKQWAISKNNIDYTLTPRLSFVQHVGVNSSLHPGRFHEYPSWPGRDYTYHKKIHN